MIVRLSLIGHLWVVVALALSAFGQDAVLQNGSDTAPNKLAIVTPVAIEKYPDAEEWARRIDETWGPGVSTEEKLAIFDSFWERVDATFPCFPGIEVDWHALRELYRPRVAAGVSRGRFAGIMSHLSLALREMHTKARDEVVARSTIIQPGTPLMQVGAWGWDNGYFGAALTPQPDGSALVYDVVENHPLGLKRGDVILGYDGIPWKQLYPEMLKLELPVKGLWGSSPETYEHTWIMAAGLNWHLFTTIDIKKYGSNAVVHLPTNMLVGSDMRLWGSEQLAVPGVPMPDYAAQNLFTWGIIEGTEVGYIYGWGWIWDAENQFYDAISKLMFEHHTKGLIIDFRYNVGGSLKLSNKGLALLFGERTATVGFAARCNPVDHTLLCPIGPTSDFDIPDDANTFYDRPIAVLTGPGACSSGDEVALRLKFHPMARFFGKSTNTAYNAAEEFDLASHWYGCVAKYSAYLASDPEHFLTHRNLQVDEEVWLTPDDVAVGKDTVVQAAVRWIEGWQPPVIRRPRRHFNR